eukprot:gene6135-biopygen5401
MSSTQRPLDFACTASGMRTHTGSARTPSVPLVPGVMHGDLCFSNILFDTRSDCIKLIDPRGLNFRDEPRLVGDLRYDLRTHQFALAGEELALPPRERTLLETLMLKAGSTVSKQALIDAIFGLDDEPSADAVDIYIHRLRKKLEASQATIITLRGVGYLLRTRQEE